MFKKFFVLLAALIAANSNVRAAEKEVKIGFISAFTGVFSSFGQQQNRALFSRSKRQTTPSLEIRSM
jgi:hypothetical protein